MGESEKWRNFTHPHSFALTPGWLSSYPIPDGHSLSVSVLVSVGFAIYFAMVLGPALDDVR